jgi:hypothetical protein
MKFLQPITNPILRFFFPTSAFAADPNHWQLLCRVTYPILFLSWLQFLQQYFFFYFKRADLSQPIVLIASSLGPQLYETSWLGKFSITSLTLIQGAALISFVASLAILSLGKHRKTAVLVVFGIWIFWLQSQSFYVSGLHHWLRMILFFIVLQEFASGSYALYLKHFLWRALQLTFVGFIVLSGWQKWAHGNFLGDSVLRILQLPLYSRIVIENNATTPILWTSLGILILVAELGFILAFWWVPSRRAFSCVLMGIYFFSAVFLNFTFFYLCLIIWIYCIFWRDEIDFRSLARMKSDNFSKES